MKFLLDIIILLIIALSIWSGYKRGVVMGIGGIIVLIIAVVVGNALSSAYSGEVVSAMRPFANGYVDGLISDEVYASGGEQNELSTGDMLAQNPDLAVSASTNALLELGLYSETAEQIALEAVDYAAENDATLSDAVSEVLCQNIAFAGGFLLFFLLCAIVLTVLGNITNLSFRIPYMGSGNEIGGAIAGLIEGIMLALVFAWVLRFAGLLFPDGVLESTWFVSFLMEHNILSSILGI